MEQWNIGYLIIQPMKPICAPYPHRSVFHHSSFPSFRKVGKTSTLKALRLISLPLSPETCQSATYDKRHRR